MRTLCSTKVQFAQQRTEIRWHIETKENESARARQQRSQREKERWESSVDYDLHGCCIAAAQHISMTCHYYEACNDKALTGANEGH